MIKLSNLILVLLVTGLGSISHTNVRQHNVCNTYYSHLRSSDYKSRKVLSSARTQRNDL